MLKFVNSINKVVCSIFLIVFVASIPKAYSATHPKNPTLTAIPQNQWVKVDTGGLSAPVGILAFSGMAYDSTNHKLLVFGGGHWNYSGNEVWAFDINSLSWTRMYAPDPDPIGLSSSNLNSNYPGALFYPANEPLSEARPLTRHTYDTVEFIDSTGEMFVTGQYTYGDSTQYYCWACGDTWTYNFNTNKWTYRNVSRGQRPSGEGSAAYDPVSNLMFYVSKGADLWTYNNATDAWSKVSTIGKPDNVNIESVATYDSKRQAIYLFGSEYPTSNDLWKYDIKTNAWSRMPRQGDIPPAAGGYGMVYDSANDVVITFRGGSTSGMWVYDLANNRWIRQIAAGGNPATGGTSDRIHGNLKYDPVNNVTFLVISNRSYNIETWAYRYGQGISDSTAPSIPGGFGAVASATAAEVNLSWSVASDPESGIAHYVIYRNGVAVRTVTGTSYIDRGLQEATTYQYSISAVNGVGMEGSATGSVSVTTTSDSTLPTIVSASAPSSRSVTVEFSEAITTNSAQLAANYSLNPTVAVSSAQLANDMRTVTLTTGELTGNVLYTLTVNNIQDRSVSLNTIATDTQTTFTYTPSSANPPNQGSYAWGTLAVGSLVYVDRSFQYTFVPDQYRGLGYLRTANDDKFSSGNAFLSFSLNAPSTIYVGYDVRNTTLPAWLQGWVNTGESLTTNDTSYQLYEKQFNAGTVDLGGNEMGNSMYVVLTGASNGNSGGGGVPGGGNNTGTGGNAALSGSSGIGGGSLDLLVGLFLLIGALHRFRKNQIYHD